MEVELYKLLFYWLFTSKWIHYRLCNINKYLHRTQSINTKVIGTGPELMKKHLSNLTKSIIRFMSRWSIAKMFAGVVHHMHFVDCYQITTTFYY